MDEDQRDKEDKAPQSHLIILTHCNMTKNILERFCCLHSSSHLEGRTVEGFISQDTMLQHKSPVQQSGRREQVLISPFNKYDKEKEMGGGWRRGQQSISFFFPNNLTWLQTAEALMSGVRGREERRRGGGEKEQLLQLLETDEAPPSGPGSAEDTGRAEIGPCCGLPASCSPDWLTYRFHSSCHVIVPLRLLGQPGFLHQLLAVDHVWSDVWLPARSWFVLLSGFFLLGMKRRDI